MLRFISRNRTLLVVVFALVAPLLTYRAHAVRPARTTLVDRLVLGLTLPFRRFLTGTTVWLSDTWSVLSDLSHAREENARLSRELVAIRRERDRFSGLATENAELARLLALKAANPTVAQRTARVIGASTSEIARTFDVDVGALDGIETGAIAVAAHGLVGVVGRVDWSTSQVIALTDPRISVHVRSARSGARGRAQGLGGEPTDPLELFDLARSDDFRVGDRLDTNGLGRVFPPGIPVGVVSRFEATSTGPRRIEVEPFVDFSRVDRLNVLLRPPPEVVLATPEPLLPSALRTATATETPPTPEDTAPKEP